MAMQDQHTDRQQLNASERSENAERSEADSQFELANRLGSEGNAGKAFQCYIAAANAGHPQACYIAAMSYIRGSGTRKNHAEAVKYLAKGAEAGDVDAQYALAEMYLDGRTLAKDEVAAMKWLTDAAEQGHTGAQYRIGKALWQGTHGLSRDPERARRYLAVAAEKGNSAAASLLERIDPFGTASLATGSGTSTKNDMAAVIDVTENRTDALTPRSWPERKCPLVLIDTSVLLRDPDVIGRVIANRGVPCITTTVLAEIDFNKTNKEDANVARNARHLLRELSRVNPTLLAEMPGGGSPLMGDTVQSFLFEGSQLLVVSRDQRHGYDSNDARIIAVARDYAMIVISADAGLKVRAQAVGVDAHVWVGPESNRTSEAASQGKARPAQANARVARDAVQALNVTQPSLRPFSASVKLIADADAPLAVASIPRAGDIIRTSSAPMRLVREISSGGEGTIYETDKQDTVCKVYHRDRLTTLRERKIKLMLSRRIVKAGLCWPLDYATNENGEFVGYVMPRAQGRPMQRSMFVKPVLEHSFPEWTRVDLVNLCLAFLDHVRHLHQLNIVIGDINPLNLLVTAESNRLAIVDTDSFQIEGFPCPVGTVNFTPPEIQGANYATFLRTRDQELFAVATMLFMILHPGKPPYAQQGGGDPAANIKGRQFAYPYHGSAIGRAPEGPWQLIWANLPSRVQEAFRKVFQDNQHVGVDEWWSILKAYRSDLLKGWHSNELFPTTFKIRDPIEVVCGSCNESVIASQRRYQEMMAVGKPFFCGKCVANIRLKILARKAREAHLAARSSHAARTESWLSSILRAPPPAPAPRRSPAWTPQKSATPRPSATQHRPGLIAGIATILGKIFR